MKQVKIGIVDSFFDRVEGKKDYATARLMGYECVDYQDLCRTNGERYKGSDDDMKAILQKDREAAEAAGVEIWQVHGPWYVDDATEESRAFNLKCMKRCALGTAMLGSKYMIVHPVMPYHWNKEDDPAWTYELNMKYFAEVADFAANIGVNVCLENMPVGHHSIGTLLQVAKFVREMNKDNFQICMDTGHANITGEDIFAGMRLAGDKLTTLHIHDNRGHSDEHRFPFTGVFDWLQFRDILKEIDYKGVYSLEPCMQDVTPVPVKYAYMTAAATATRSLAL